MTERQFANLTVKIWHLRRYIESLEAARKNYKKWIAKFKREGKRSPAFEKWVKDYPNFHGPAVQKLEALCRKLAAHA